MSRLSVVAAISMLAASFSMPAAVAWAGGELTLAAGGASRYVVVLPAEATAVERTAARELQEHLAKVTGATLPIVSEAEVPDGAPRIAVGFGALARKLLPDLDPAKLPPDAIVIKTVGNDLVLVGHPRRGTLYAVFTFLEETVGVRWWTQTETHIPNRPDLAIPPLDVTYAPVIEDRATRYLELSDGCFTNHSLVTEEEQLAMGIFSARLRLNGHDHYSIPDEYGGPNGLVGWVHTFFQINGLLPPAKYFEDHPEWYSLIDGKRQYERAQLCLTNEEMLAEMIRVVSERLQANPGATMISVSQNDWHGNCQCDKCRAIDEKEGTPAGSLIHFVNAIAAGIEPAFPHIKVETLAYQYTRKPPKFIRPRHNVVVRLCSIECSFAEPLEAGEQNVQFREDLEGWSRIAPHVYIWDYITNFRSYLIPHPNYHVLAPNIRYFVRNNAIGVFQQGDSGSRVGEFIRLRAWLVARLLWNPDADEQKLIEEFMTGYYGPAAPHLIEYIQVMTGAAQRSGVYLRCYMPDTRSWLTLDDLNRATRLFARASDAVQDDPVLAARVRRERLPIDLVWLQQYDSLKREARREGAEFLGPEDPEAALAEYRQLLKQHNAGEYRQGRLVPEDFGDDFSFFLRKRVPAGDIPELCKGLPKEDWIDLQEADYIPRTEPNVVRIDKDGAASNGLTRRMPNTHRIWACHSYPLGDYGVTDGSRWQVYFALRCDAKTDEGAAMTIGIYDDANRQSVATRQISVEAIRGSQYHTIDLGVHALTPQMYIWGAPVVRDPAEVEAVYVDRVFLKRAE
ncbi:MAG: DUF4838 domain-containing protein [Thermoguttaceae bacterium]|nr:DUF4838 domain-containing protein [Thermoguttaceae bacterium]